MLLQMALFCSVLWMGNTPFVYVYHIFVHLSVDGHLSCFRVLAVVNSAAVNIGCVSVFWLLYVFVAVRGLSLAAESREHELLSGLSAVVWASLCGSFSLRQSMGSRAHRLQWLWHMGLAALWHVESSQIRDQTCVPCVGRQIPIHFTTREILHVSF